MFLPSCLRLSMRGGAKISNLNRGADGTSRRQSFCVAEFVMFHAFLTKL